MISERLRRKLERRLDLPAMPFVISQLLRSLDDTNIRAGKLAELIEKDQGLTSRVLSVANSPFYGFSRKISTVELAIVIMGLNSIKEIVIGLIVKRLFSRGVSGLDTKEFWQYSLFCGAASRLIARKMDYPLAGEAFVAGLIHDLGVLVINKFLPNEASEIWSVSASRQLPLEEAERYVLGDSHSEIGAWLANKWRLPEHLCAAVENHHRPLDTINGNDGVSPLTAIVSLSEWFAHDMGYNKWYNDHPLPLFYLEGSIITDMTGESQMTKKASLEKLRLEIRSEFERAAAFSETSNTVALYK